MTSKLRRLCRSLDSKLQKFPGSSRLLVAALFQSCKVSKEFPLAALFQSFKVCKEFPLAAEKKVLALTCI